MFIYILYRIAHFVAMTLPRRIAYKLACFIADLYYYICANDRKGVSSNLKFILGGNVDDKKVKEMSREVFRNFAKYLVDFFRLAKVNDEYIKKFIKIEGLENINAALSSGKGGIMLSAHIGNWELGAAVLSLMGYPLSAVVLTHQNKRINDFFRRQRLIGKTKPIEIGISLKACYYALKNNGLLALLGDRDFTRNGLVVDFFGKKAMIPRGPAFFSYRIGSPIIPVFMVRQPDDTFRLVFSEPIAPAAGGDEDAAITEITKKCVSVMETNIGRYPTQWYIFKNLWNTDEKDMCPDTII